MLEDIKICYILDAVLLLYGLILTVLYGRLKIQHLKDSYASSCPEKQAPGQIYVELSAPGVDTYETIHVEKKQSLA
ncbi:unnamed protein product [Knipowitschia caucasica]